MDKEFLLRLKQKLQIGNTRSIHLNSSPGRLLTRLDAFELNSLQPGLSDKFIKSLLSEEAFSFKFNINPDDFPAVRKIKSETDIPEDENKNRIGVLSKRLTSMLYENEDNFLEHGIKTFGFGFPIIAYRPKSDPAKTIYAPVIIWKLDVSRNKNEWTIYRDDEYGISLNEVLLNYLEQDQGSTGLTRISEEELSDNIVDSTELLSICNTLMKEIGKENPDFALQENLLPLEDKEKVIKQFAVKGNPFLLYSGVFGLFRSQKEAVIRDIKELISNINDFKFDDLVAEKYQTTTFTSIETDPAQSKVLTDLGEKSKLIIHGPPGTGKSQSLTAIIANALANNVKCLVVCEKKTALEVIRKNLEMKGLGELCGIIEDVNRDRKSIVTSARERNNKSEEFDFKLLEDIILETKSKIDSVNSGHKIYGRQILNTYNWTNLVGRYLNLRKKTNLTERLFAELKSDTFDFNSDSISIEYNKLINLLKELSVLYNETKDSLTDFQYINDNLLTSSTQVEIAMKLKPYLEKLDEAILSILKHIEEITSEYEKKLLVYFEKYKTFTQGICKDIINLYQKNKENDRFLKEGRIMIKVLSLFSSSAKQTIADKARISDLFLQLKKYSGYNYFFFTTESTKLPDRILYHANGFLENLDKWYTTVPELAKSMSANLSADSKSDITDFNFDKLTKLFENYSLLLKSINDSAIFNTKFTSDVKTIKELIDKLNSLKNFINRPLSKMPDFADFYAYRTNYVKADSKIQKIINGLILTNSLNWEVDGEAWFIFNLLINYDYHISLKNDAELNALRDNFVKISKYQVLDILKTWRAKQSMASGEFKKANGYDKSTLYNLNRNKQYGKQNSLRKIIYSDFNLFTDYFPVMLVNPTVCSSLFRMTEGMFDVVIFDEASQLRVEDVYAAKLRGKHKIIAGDENQMPPSSYFAATLSMDTLTDESEEEEFTGASASIADSESLLEYAKRKGYSETYLEVHYRSKHPDLIEFSNAAFYGSRLKPMPPREAYTAIKYFAVSGIYSQEEGINEDESKKVLEIIDSEVNLSNGKIPSIGIATLNLMQRNQILNAINDKCDKEPEFAKKIYKLKEIKGEELFVKNLENIQGDERDIIIISTTFGLRENGNFIQNYGPLNQEKGYRLLNVIVTRAKYRLYVCTSIPEKYINEYSQLISAGTNNGRAFFYSYLAYAKAVSENDVEKKASIIKLLSDKSDAYVHPDDAFTESVFEQEVLDLLSENFDRERIKIQYPLGGFRIDMVVLSQDLSKPVIAIECDGASYHSSSEAYSWDLFRQKVLEGYGLKFIRIWSTNWFNNQQKELERLLHFINANSGKIEM